MLFGNSPAAGGCNDTQIVWKMKSLHTADMHSESLEGLSRIRMQKNTCLVAEDHMKVAPRCWPASVVRLQVARFQLGGNAVFAFCLAYEVALGDQQGSHHHCFYAPDGRKQK